MRNIKNFPTQVRARSQFEGSCLASIIFAGRIDSSKNQDEVPMIYWTHS